WASPLACPPLPRAGQTRPHASVSLPPSAISPASPGHQPSACSPKPPVSSTPSGLSSRSSSPRSPSPAHSGSLRHLLVSRSRDRWCLTVSDCEPNQLVWRFPVNRQGLNWFLCCTAAEQVEALSVDRKTPN